MKYKWLKEKPTIKEIETITGVKVKSLTIGDIEVTDGEGLTKKGIEIDFEEEVPEVKLKDLDDALAQSCNCKAER